MILSTYDNVYSPILAGNPQKQIYNKSHPPKIIEMGHNGNS